MPSCMPHPGIKESQMSGKRMSKVKCQKSKVND